MSPSCTRPHHVLACALLAAFGLAAAVGAAAEPCPAGPFDPAELPALCAPVLLAPADAAGPEAIVVRSHERDPLGTLSLRPAAAPDDGLVLEGDLPDLAGHRALVPADDASLWPCPVRVDDSQARVVPVEFASADGSGRLWLANEALDGEPRPGWRAIIFLYADSEVRIEGTCDTPSSILHVEFSLQGGWNAIVSELRETVPAAADRPAHDVIVLRDVTSDDLATVAWYWSVSAVDAGESEPLRPPSVRPVEPPAQR